ncbi:hypothetical protein PNIG_b0482 [Pseudoalteromonas nigrifaciens]|uniref:N-acetyltransferase domain-containing protein n=1 Tax=Pseudoalteromonas nigrifaciens TaxID=28109 RepID=A0AAC9ULV7_9GAMM|nr:MULTISPECIES: GNAT family N-acetyltransferase [Pseudoalteromonas]ASM56063.1 hypothetical protein PNIG_b0482 [Pseudoalteromonas nigrifaciens]MBB1371189.1 GNAT family N-acetyltransferase [Pseudoalteromonas sp. SR45-4]MBB1405084.1 GNAT family N-acetyltransferase [Pseudoalteromonas sp. SG44-5]MBE0420908.1 GNAT family N-acetyltransferase [Pseudoalteromonas nigrifaciens]MBH0072039.1 GNAT family N-acetyltransferase [Pseudoalteromonas sp. NZS127]|tara:strand:+ start:375 stop:881 length:507 start_codon:yes stop_codon:yes gene_type:complete
MRRQFNTERLIIRHAVEADAGDLLKLVNQKSFIKYIGDKKIYTLEDAITYIKQAFSEAHQSQGFGPYVITLKNQQLVGVVGFYSRAMLQHPDIGFALLTAFEKQGYIYEAAKALVENKSIYGINKLCAITSIDNSASQNVLIKLGFKPQGQVIIDKESRSVVSLFLYH